jgi:hypothetical protein
MTISEDVLRARLAKRNAQGKKKESLRKIAESYKNVVTYGDIDRIITHGIFPVGDKKRKVLGLAPTCPTCYRRIPKPVTPNQLLNKSIQDVPTELLRWAFENREEVNYGI